MPTVIRFTCPAHGTIVEYDPPGPAEAPSKYCGRRLTLAELGLPEGIVCLRPWPTCRERLERTEAEA